MRKMSIIHPELKRSVQEHLKEWMSPQLKKADMDLDLKAKHSGRGSRCCQIINIPEKNCVYGKKFVCMKLR